MSEENSVNIVEGLNKVVADAMVMYQKLHHYHWNVTGDEFFSLHAKFEELYDYMALVVDDTAERVLTIGGKPPRTLGEMLELTSIVEDATLPDDEEDMVEAIANDFKKIVADTLPLVEAAEEARDRGTANLLDDMRDQLEKHIWMLNAFLDD
jgi:starvation-inducible DNA-binding protein